MASRELGKPCSFQELGRRVGGSPVTALRLIHSKTPERLVRVTTPFLIDGLDQLIASREGEAVDAVLSQLEAAGSREFIISCRARGVAGADRHRDAPSVRR